MNIPVIQAPEQVTAAWLTLALNQAGFPGRVEDFTRTPIGTGQVGENVRFTLKGERLPASVVGKFPSRDPSSRKAGVELNNYAREVFYYRQLDETVDIRTPEVFFCDLNEENHDFVILMEDLAPGVQGDQLAGCSLDEAALALEELAKLQGPRWGDASLRRHPLLSVRGERQPETPSLGDFYRMLQPGFLERYADRLTAEQADTVRAVGARLDDYHAPYQGPPCLVHVDYRLDNMLFGGPAPLTVVDWQSVALGCPVEDAAYFLGTSLSTRDRRSEERALLKLYLERLAGYGAELSWETCYALYRNYAPAGIVMAVLASMLVGETARGNDMFMAMATRSAEMTLDLAD